MEHSQFRKVAVDGWIRLRERQSTGVAQHEIFLSNIRFESVYM